MAEAILKSLPDVAQSNLRIRRSLGCLQLDASSFETSVSNFVDSKGRRKSEGDIGLQHVGAGQKVGSTISEGADAFGIHRSTSLQKSTSEVDIRLQCVGTAQKFGPQISDGADASGIRRSTSLQKSQTWFSGIRLSGEEVTTFEMPERQCCKHTAADGHEISDSATLKCSVNDKLDASTESNGIPNSSKGPGNATKIDRPSSARRSSKTPSSARRSSRGPGNAMKIDRPSSAKRSSLPSNSKLCQPSPAASPRRVSTGALVSPRRRSSGVPVSKAATFSPGSRRRRSDADMLVKNSNEQPEDCVFSFSKSLMDRWTRRTIFQKARVVYAQSKVAKALKTPLDMLNLAAKATHIGVHHTLMEHRVIDCWRQTYKEGDDTRQKSEASAPNGSADASQQNPVDAPVEVSGDVLLEDFRGLASTLGELRKVANVELLPQSIGSALNAIDVKLDKFDILNDLMHMHNCTYSELSSKFDSQMSEIARIISTLTTDFRLFQQCVHDEMAKPTADNTGLKTFLPAVEHCLVHLGIITSDLGDRYEKKALEDYDFEGGASVSVAAGSVAANRVPRSQCRRWSLGGAPIICTREDGRPDEKQPAETKVVSEHDAPEILVYDSGKKDDDESSLGGFSDESDAEVQAFADRAWQADSSLELLTTQTNQGLEMSADPPLQTDAAPQVDRSESVSSDELPMMSSRTEPERRPSHNVLSSSREEKSFERSIKKQKTWQSSSSNDYHWQAVSTKLKQEKDQVATLGKLFGGRSSPCPQKVSEITSTASVEVCKAHEALGKAYGLSHDELDKLCHFLKCENVQDIGIAARKLAKELGGEERVLEMIRRELGKEIWSKAVSWWHEEQQTSTQDARKHSCGSTSPESGRYSAAASSATPSRNPPSDVPALPTGDSASASSNHETSFSNHESVPKGKGRIQVAKPSQPRSKFNRSIVNVKKCPEECSTDTLSVLQTKLLTTILDEDVLGERQSDDLLQIVCNASASEYVPQARKLEPQLKVKLPWDDDTDVTCQSRPCTTGRIGFERWEGLPAPLPSIGGAAQGMIGGSFASRPGTTPGSFRSQSWRNQLTSKTRPTPGSYQSLIWRRDQLNPHSLPVLVGRCK